MHVLVVLVQGLTYIDSFNGVIDLGLIGNNFKYTYFDIFKLSFILAELNRSLIQFSISNIFVVPRLFVKDLNFDFGPYKLVTLRGHHNFIHYKCIYTKGTFGTRTII